MKIYGDLLSILDKEDRPEKIVLTRIQVQMKVPFDRLKIYIKELKDLDLVQNDISLKPTEKGKEFITEYEKIIVFMKRMGIAYR